MADTDKRIKVTQTRSTIGHKKSHLRTLEALGLGRIGRSKVHNATPSVVGMVRSVFHLVETQVVESQALDLEESSQQTVGDN